MGSARFLSHMNHVSVSPTDGNGPRQGQRKTLTRVGIEPTTFGLDLCGDLTRRSWDSQISGESIGCSCGKNTARGNKASCQPLARKVCPCVRKGLRCTRKCICKNCCNVDRHVTDNTGNSNESVGVEKTW